MDDRTSTGNAWQAHPALAWMLRAFAVLVPILVSLVLTIALRLSVPTPHEAWLRWAWAGVLVVTAVATAIGVERQARRLMPLVTLLKLSMLFPDRAPSRFSVARSAGSVRKLEALLAEGDTEASRTASTILSLSVALRSHDRRTRGHAERVRVFTDLLGEELELPEADRYRLRWAALLHDIGKLTVSSRILNKPAALDDREWERIRGHPDEGARIAAPLLGWLGPWGHAIAQHHERFDGNGYPSGLGGASISLAGRIVAVADCYDTMTAARSYKKPMAVWAARRELAECAGGQFDPEIVRAFLSISLPRLLWRTGPLSFAIQLPFLWRLQEVGLQSVTAMTQGATMATVAAGVTAMAVAGPIDGPMHQRDHMHSRIAASETIDAAPTTPGTTAGLDPSPVPSAHTIPEPDHGPTPTPSPGQPPASPIPTSVPSSSEPTSSPSEPTSSPNPSPTVTPTPRPSPTTRPSPLPSPLPTTTPLPSPSLPPRTPLPTPLPTVPTVPTAPTLPSHPVSGVLGAGLPNMPAEDPVDTSSADPDLADPRQA